MPTFHLVHKKQRAVALCGFTVRSIVGLLLWVYGTIHCGFTVRSIACNSQNVTCQNTHFQFKDSHNRRFSGLICGRGSFLADNLSINQSWCRSVRSIIYDGNTSLRKDVTNNSQYCKTRKFQINFCHFC